MRTLIGLLLSLACACTGTRTGNPGHNGDLPSGVVVAQSELAREDHPALSSANAETLGTDNRAFAFALYRELSKEPGNLFFSPYSISTALAMTYAGARGTTETEMATALHFTLPQSDLHAAFNATDLALAKRKDQLAKSDGPVPTKGDGFELHIVNQAWGRQGYTFLDSYLDVLAVNYGAGLYLLDFSGKPDEPRVVINDWVADQTEQRIKDLLPDGSITGDTALVLTNAIYFKASWFEEFDPAATKPGTFTAEAGTRNVDMMHAFSETGYAEVDGYRAIALPYISKDVKMLMVLPPEGSFGDATSGFDATLFDGLLSQLQEATVTLSLPKWKFESEKKLKAPLQALGMRAAFDDGAADFSGMDGSMNLWIDAVYHKAFVAVDEEGTEAAAATAVVARDESASLPVTLTFDRPFMFLIYDDPTGQILFVGHLTDPG
ncbi:MAG TPA: serpin family protein [Polyangiales bacterium]|nr:serpin family protein [Polyangiales bacterium]